MRVVLIASVDRSTRFEGGALQAVASNRRSPAKRDRQRAVRIQISRDDAEDSAAAFAGVDGALARLLGIADPVKPPTEAAVRALEAGGVRARVSRRRIHCHPINRPPLPRRAPAPESTRMAQPDKARVAASGRERR